MERESFEDQDVAEILNRYFVSVKVDREERPDIDHMYMAYCQAMTGSGGWPLTIIMTPDKQPFFAGTYFPKHSHYGRPGMMELLTQIAELWQNEKDKVLETAAKLYEAVANHYQEKKISPGYTRQRGIQVSALGDKESVYDWGKAVIRKGYALLERNFDRHYGGFGSAPKFPSPHNLGFLLRFHLEEPDMQAFSMAEKTLIAMADGGIYDHIGFGFARYSTDRYWLVPHFEKMLYDNAGLALVYLEAYQLTKKESFVRIAREIFQYILRDMTSPEGGFYSAEDADSEGVEGKFYIWDELEIKVILQREIRAIIEGNSDLKGLDPKVKELLGKHPEKIPDLFCEAYGITEDGHYEGKNIPNRIFGIWGDIAERNGLTLAEMDELLGLCRQILFKEREKRVHPAKDDKILVSWNGLMIAALAKGAQVFFAEEKFRRERDALLQAAEKAVGFILAKMFNPKGRLLARYRAGEADYLAYLDDYAFFIYGLLELYTACGKPEYLAEALKLQDEQERLFKDETNGGYYFTGNDAEELLFRPKEIYDGAMPSGNSITAYNLAKLWKLTGDKKWQELAEEQFAAFQTVVNEYPAGYTAFLQAIQFYLAESDELVLSGELHTPELAKMQAVIFEDFRPYTVIAYNEGTLANIVPRMKDYPIPQKQVKAYLCRNFACREPVDKAEELRALLNEP
ncbi:MAG TPA: thioredoxin domain-containing protein [Peptococcaceae bacterium]|nr:thioredoxin domain-containing protein [Peptococcaceae bacterium]